MSTRAETSTPLEQHNKPLPCVLALASKHLFGISASCRLGSSSAALFQTRVPSYVTLYSTIDTLQEFCCEQFQNRARVAFFSTLQELRCLRSITHSLNTS